MRNAVFYYGSPLVNVIFPDLKWTSLYDHFLVTIQEFFFIYAIHILNWCVYLNFTILIKKDQRTYPNSSISTNPFIFNLFDVLNI